ncbi:MAG: HAMP domain-containing sensor histidine kinase [Chromatiales bacterium]|mgnify:FL=1|jgi:signal transduction histidine kinase
MSPASARLNLDAPRWQRYLLQAIFIFLSVLLSLYAVTWVLQRVLVKEALQLEAESFISERAKDPGFPLPRTRNLLGYLDTGEGTADMPVELQELDSGLHLAVTLAGREKPLPVYVEDSGLGRLYLVFKGYNVDRLVGLFGVIPLGILLIIVYGTSWIAYRLSAGAVSPVLRIARRLRKSSVDQAPLAMPMTGLKGEAKELALAVDEYTRRMDAMVDRERQFSSDVSHELRTPMTIIDGAAQFLETDSGLSEKGRQRALMIRRACKDVSELIDAFLILGREPALLDEEKSVDVAEVAESELAKLSMLLEQEPVRLELVRRGKLSVPVNPKIFEIIIGNLCRNALKYTDSGAIRVIITETGLRVEDSGPGIDEQLIPHIFERHVRGRGLQQAGEGLGLNIVKRLCDLYHWQISIANRPDGGVAVALEIPPESLQTPAATS